MIFCYWSKGRRWNVAVFSLINILSFSLGTTTKLTVNHTNNWIFILAEIKTPRRMLSLKAFSDQPKHYFSSVKIYVFRTIHTQISHAFSIKQIVQMKTLAEWQFQLQNVVVQNCKCNHHWFLRRCKLIYGIISTVIVKFCPQFHKLEEFPTGSWILIWDWFSTEKLSKNST